MTDNVNHPQHYEKHKIVLEPIDVIGSAEFCIGNVIKYVVRARDKGNFLEDLKKARFYHDKSLEFWSSQAESYVCRFAVFYTSDNYMLAQLGRHLMCGKSPFKAWSSLGRTLNDWINDEEKEEEDGNVDD